MSKNGQNKKKNSKLGDKVAMSIFNSAVPALIARWRTYCEENASDVTFDEFLINIMNEYKGKEEVD